jgi:hypothetical protein
MFSPNINGSGFQGYLDFFGFPVEAVCKKKGILPRYCPDYSPERKNFEPLSNSRLLMVSLTFQHT